MKARNVVLGVLLMFGLAAAAPLTAAAENAQAEAFIQTLANRAIDVVKADSLPRTEQSKMLREILRDSFDVKTIGNFALGTYRRKASKAQLAVYHTEFEDFIVYTYSSRLGKFAGETVAVVGTRPACKSKSDVFVDSEIQRTGKEAIPIAWRVRDYKGRMKVIDVEIEGTNQILAYRQEFASVIKVRGQGVDGLIAELREKNASLQNKIAASN